ncbi:MULTISPECIES: transposase [unclassified Tardiphaga]|uniref:transposase n=1 Tax=unclassified Tardiphaga TaxID=2631404 RepID=UPI00143CD8D7|nr:transposase [Tardiphaga sp.]
MVRAVRCRTSARLAAGGPKVRASQKRHTRLISKIRAEVEGVFATLKRWLGFVRVRYRGLPKNIAHFNMVALAYNMRRSLNRTAQGLRAVKTSAKTPLSQLRDDPPQGKVRKRRLSQLHFTT